MERNYSEASDKCVRVNDSHLNLKDCQLCGMTAPMNIIDGRTKGGQWAWMCPGCHEAHGVGFGVGRGQMFDNMTMRKVK